MITIKNYMLFGEFGSEVSKLCEKVDIKPVVKFRLIKIFKELESCLSRIEESRPVMSTQDKKMYTDKDKEMMANFNELLMESSSIDAEKICIESVLDILSTKDLLTLDPILKSKED